MSNKNRRSFWLPLLACVFVGSSFFFTPTPVVAAPSLGLSAADAPVGVVKLQTVDPSKANSGVQSVSKQAVADNDQLIKTLIGGGVNGLLGNLIKLAKYVLGAVFMLFFGIYVLQLIIGIQNQESYKEFKKQATWALVGFLIFVLAEPVAQTFNPFSEDGRTFVTDAEVLQQSSALGVFSLHAAVQLFEYLLGAIALIFMAVAAFNIITAGGDEAEIKTSRKTLIWSTVGLLFAIGIGELTKVFAPPERISTVDPLLAHIEILQFGWRRAHILTLAYVKYFETFIGAIAVLMLFLAGFKMVSAAGNDEIISKQRKMITWIFLGISTIMIAEIFVNVFLPPTPSGAIGFENQKAITTFAESVGGLTNFFLVFSGSVAVLALTVGALFLTTAAANPEQAEKGKKILLSAALGLVITISAYALVNTVLSDL